MKKFLFLALNILLILLTVLLCIRYDRVGGLTLKGITASGFVILGAVNLAFALLQRKRPLSFPLLMALALCLCMAGDIALNISFLPGCALFTAGHAVYILSFCMLQKPALRDLIPCGGMFLLSFCILQWGPHLNFGMPPMAVIVYLYALIISCMVGKAVSLFLENKSAARCILMLGSILFYISDVMLLFWMFGWGGQLADTLCLYTYFPGQCLMAHALYWFAQNAQTPEAAKRTA